MRYLFLIFLVGCYSARKAENQVNKAIEKHPETVLPIFRGKYPCQIIHVDTSYTLTDTIINVDCPDAQYFEIHDTTVLIKTKTQTVTKRIQLPVQMITKTIKDSSFEYEYQIKLNQYKVVNELKDQQINELKGKTSKRTWLAISFLLALIISILLRFIKR